jgi:glycosyltransferase involved in cell wall biosynthesis
MANDSSCTGSINVGDRRRLSTAPRGAAARGTGPARCPEAKGLSAIEALAAGVPVLTAGHGAFPEILDGERAGLLTDEDMAGLPAGTAIP